MQSICGRVTHFLRDTTDRVNGFVLDSGEQVGFALDAPEGVAKSIAIGTVVEISGEWASSGKDRKLFTAASVRKLGSMPSSILPGSVRPGNPGMLSNATPTTTASLALPPISEDARDHGGCSPAWGNLSAMHLEPKSKASSRGQGPHASIEQEHPYRHSLPLPRAQRGDSALEIERAYDRLHRIQAVLAYLNIMKRQVHGISQMHEEAKHTYEQAISRHEAHDFEGARELATASRYLSRVVEDVISKELRSDTSYPSLVPRPPEHSSAPGESSRVEDDLEEVMAVLSRIHWIMENGTLPLEDRTQVRRIVAWSDAFYQQSKRMYQRGFGEDAIDLARAARATAHSAEHVCRNWYVAQAANSQDHRIPSDYPALA